MNEPRNTRSVAGLFSGFDSTLRHYMMDRPRAYWRVVQHKLRNLPETNFKLGTRFALQGKWMDAAFRFRFALYLRPDYVAAHYNLGCCYMQLRRPAEARASFLKALHLQPQHREALFMLSAVAPDQVPPERLPRRMPQELVTGFFTQMAPHYDRQVEINGYDGPRLVAEGCKPYLPATHDLHMVDLGCGTGLVARPWRRLCREVLGVDLTHAMVTLAQQARAGDHPVFDRVLEGDITDLPPGTFMPGATDVVICCDTAQFIGDLAPLMAMAAAALKTGGLLALTVEPFAAEHGYGVNPATGRFGHALEYVNKTAQAAGLRVKNQARVTLYTAMQAQLFVFAKSGETA